VKGLPHSGVAATDDVFDAHDGFSHGLVMISHFRALLHRVRASDQGGVGKSADF